jgi:TetR/AcrR family transcriptional regulator, transcriptional repressor for nem operon
MRKSQKETARTRERIVKKAGQAFMRGGIAESGLVNVMASAGLTQGGFYRHFASKDQLVSEAFEKSLDAVLCQLEEKDGDEALAEILHGYLSQKHRDNYSEACPLAALGTELSRADGKTHAAASAGLDRFIAAIETKLSSSHKDAKARARAIAAAMIGGIIISRITTDEKLSNSILRDTKAFVLEAQ